MVTCFSERGRGSAAALSVNALYFQHEGTHCHVTAGWSEPNSIKITEIPLNTSVLELEAVTDTCLFNVLDVSCSRYLECEAGKGAECCLFYFDGCKSRAEEAAGLISVVLLLS